MKMGRPKGSTKLTLDIIQQLQQCLQEGTTIKSACEECGISYGSFRNWRLLGRKAKKGIFRKFTRVIEAIFMEKMRIEQEKCQEIVDRELLRLKARRESLIRLGYLN